MMKKLTSFIVVFAIIISLCGVVKSYNSGDVICSVTENSATNCTRRFMFEYGVGSNNLYNKKWYLYNSDGCIYTDKSCTTRAAFEPKNQSESLLFKVATENAYLTYDATDYEDTWFYATSSDSRASLRIASNGTYKQSATMTYETELTFSNEFAGMDLLIITKSGTAYGQIGSTIPYIKAIRINDNGMLIPDISATTQQYGTLTLGEKHKIAIVLMYTESATNQGKYTYKKSVFLDEQLLWSGDGNEEIESDLKFNGIQMNIEPWEITSNAGYTPEAEGTNYLDSTAITHNVYKHTLKATKFEMNTMAVYAGNTYELIPAYNTLDIIYDGGDNADCVKNNISLPTTVGDEAKVSWASSNENIVSAEGVVNANSFVGYEKEVTLTATIKNFEETNQKTKIFKIRVVKDLSRYEDSEIVNMELNLITFATLTDEDHTAVTKNIVLPNEGQLKSKLTWTATDCDGAEIDDDKLKVTQSKRESYYLVLTVYAEYGQASASKEFEITIPKKTVDPQKYTLIDTMVDDSKMFSYSDDLVFTGKGSLVNDFGWIDGYAAEPKSVEAIPWIIYKFNSPIKGFSVDAIYTRRSDQFPTDFSFFVSNDALQWIPVAKEQIKTSIAKTHNGKGYFPANFTCDDINFKEYYKYLKVVFGDISTQGTNARTFSITLDTVTVNLVSNCNEAYDDLTFDDLTDESIDAVVKKLSLPTTGLYNTSITWESTNESVISTDGTVDHSAYKGYQIPVTLTAIIENDEEIFEKKFDIIVTRDVSNFGEKDYVDYDLGILTFDYLTDQPIENVVSDIHLPDEIEGGSKLTWSIDNTECASLVNNVLSFTPQKESVTPLTLTVTSTYGANSDTKKFNIGILRTFGTNLLSNATITASSDGARKILSRDMTTYWQSEEKDNERTIYVNFNEKTAFNAALIVEKGNNVSDYTVYASDDCLNWNIVYQGISNGDGVRKAVSFEEVKCKYVKVVFNAITPVKIISLELYNEIVTEEQSVFLSLKELSLPSSTTSNLILPQKGKYSGVITWKSGDTSIITDDGVIKQSENKSRTTTLTATLTYNSIKLTKVFTVTVPGKIVAGGGGGLKSGIGGGGAAGGAVAAAKAREIGNITNGQNSGADVFCDVNESHWAYKYIDKLVKNGVISSDTAFRPSDSIKREEFIKLLVVAMNINDTQDGKSFTDVDAGQWYYPYVMKAKNAGIVSGNDDGTFGIGADIIRQDAAVMIYRLIAENNDSMEMAESNNFVDGSAVSLYAAEAVKYLSENGIFNGDENNRFLPFNNLTRAESAKIICLAMQMIKEDENAK